MIKDVKKMKDEKAIQNIKWKFCQDCDWFISEEDELYDKCNPDPIVTWCGYNKDSNKGYCGLKDLLKNFLENASGSEKENEGLVKSGTLEGCHHSKGEGSLIDSKLSEPINTSKPLYPEQNDMLDALVHATFPTPLVEVRKLIDESNNNLIVEFVEDLKKCEIDYFAGGWLAYLRSLINKWEERLI